MAAATPLIAFLTVFTSTGRPSFPAIGLPHNYRARCRLSRHALGSQGYRVTLERVA